MNIKYLAVIMAMACLSSTAQAAQSKLCKPEKSAGWPNNYDVVDGCRYRFSSSVPGRYVTFEEGTFSLVDSDVETLLAPFGAPSQFAWAPGGRYFYINDGEGSGLDSSLNLYDLSRGGLIDNLTIRRRLDRLFASKLSCKVESRTPTTWGLGWSRDATRLYVLVQSLPGQYCRGEPDFYVATIALPSCRILGFEPAGIAQRKFGALLPDNMRKPDS